MNLKDTFKISGVFSDSFGVFRIYRVFSEFLGFRQNRYSFSKTIRIPNESSHYVWNNLDIFRIFRVLYTISRLLFGS